MNFETLAQQQMQGKSTPSTMEAQACNGSRLSATAFKGMMIRLGKQKGELATLGGAALRTEQGRSSDDGSRADCMPGRYAHAAPCSCTLPRREGVIATVWSCAGAGKSVGGNRAAALVTASAPCCVLGENDQA